jgi:hypothetical protein
MKKLFSIILTLVMGVLLYSQANSEGDLPEFSRAYLNAVLTYNDSDFEYEGGSVYYYEGANAFAFNVDGNSVLYYPHSGSVERFIYIGETMEGVDDVGDAYQLIKTIEVESSEIVYFQLYDNKKYGLKLIYEESLMVIHFFNKLIE